MSDTVVTWGRRALWATAAAVAVYGAAVAAAAVWGSLTLTRIRRGAFTPSVRLRRAVTRGTASPTTGDEPLWHPAVALTGGPIMGARGVVELAGPAVDVPGLWGLEWYDADGGLGYAQLGDVLAHRHDEETPGGRVVRRRVHVLRGDLTGPVARDGEGVDAALCAYAWPDDLDVLARELAGAGIRARVREVGIASTGGLFPATLITPESRGRSRGTWVIAIHGRGSRRTQIHRMARTLTRCGATTLAITYRGDEGTPLEDWRSTLGALEWHEVESAVNYALMHGARRVVLYGFSMGGAIGTAFLRRSPLAGAVTALVLDAPVLDWGPVLRIVAEGLRLPRPAVPLTMTVAQWLVGADFALVNRLLPPQDPSAGGGCRPTLLVHGTDDPVVPVCSSDMLAEAEPGAVRYLRVPGAGHTTAYNFAPERYETHLSAFLAEVAAGPSAPAALRRATRQPAT